MFLKRAFDIVVSLIGVVLLMPLLLTVVIVSLIANGAPVFFLQKRVGYNGRHFKVIKFRTMAVAADIKDIFTLGESQRTTKIGKILRKTKIDEIPQLFNVLRGDMSLVGPRPEVPEWVKVYPERWARVHKVLPGITDPASLVYRNEEIILSESEDPKRMYRNVILPHKLALYERYVRERSLKSDVCIIFKTVKALF